MTTTSTETYEDYDFEQSGGADVAKESSKGGDFDREVMFLSLKGDAASVSAGKNKMLVRFVTDFQKPQPDQPSSKFNLPWITANEHNYLNTKQRPDWLPEKMRWPAKMSGGCRKDKIFVKKFGGACYFCDNLKAKVSARTWALAIEREEVRSDDGATILGFRDKMRKVFDRDEKGEPIVLGEENGKKKYQMKDAPAWIVMNQGWKNFYANLNGQASYFGTILDADWLITRTGEDTESTYSFVRVGEQVIPPEGYVVNGLDLSAAYGGQKFDLRLPGLMEALYPDMPDLRRIIAERVRQDIIDRYFVPGWTPPEEELARYRQQSGGQPSGQQSGGGAPMMMNTNPAQPAAAGGTAEVPSDAMAALKARINGQGS